MSEPEGMVYSTAYRSITPGDTAEILLPHSEVCMHMQVAGKVMRVHLTGGQRTPSHEVCAQIFTEDGTRFSSPVLPAEAGIYHGPQGWYYYPPRPAGRPGARRSA